MWSVLSAYIKVYISFWKKPQNRVLAISFYARFTLPGLGAVERSAAIASFSMGIHYETEIDWINLSDGRKIYKQTEKNKWFIHPL